MLQFHTVILGSGAAGYAAADRLLAFGVKDIAMLTCNRTAGTSRNAGSDKQTYYKISCTDEDSPLRMAEALSFGGGMHKDTAFIEAANSLRCFTHLAEYGVPFPTDAYGRFVGYQTDHDTANRGTSAGPLTSKYMTECLEKRVLHNKNFTLLDETTAIRIVTETNRAVGVIALQKDGNSYRLLPIQTKYILAATGGAACAYQNTVYPDRQTGALGLLKDAGCKFCNLTEWQYGIASLGVKWNLSGSYQQVIPTYYSVDKHGRKTEFLKDSFANAAKICNTVFLKGYQWPFDSQKVNGSSKIDLAVSKEKAKGNRVYLDYRKNPDGFDFARLSNTAKQYLLSAGAVGETPLERLSALNPQAIAFFKSKGIDLENEPLEIAVCAQHINGGADVDMHWQTSVENLFAVGETAGTFGLYRPGGSALNSTQVGALRAAEYISANEVAFSAECIINTALQAETAYIAKCLISTNDQTDFSADMSKFAAENRNLDKISDLNEKLQKQCDLRYYRLAENTYKAVQALYRYRDTVQTQYVLCSAFSEILPQTGSRGGYICTQNGTELKENEYYRDFAVVTENDKSAFVPLRDFPDLQYSFEKEWNRFNRERGITLD
ncbi:MAG: FAD-binding protein [Candidatus Fimenecus sp.]